MSLWDEIANDGDEILSELGREVTFRDKKILALIDTNNTEQTLADGGFMFSTGFRVRFLIKKGSDLAKNIPKHGESVTVYDTKLYISQTTYRPPSPWMDVYVLDRN